MRTLRPPTACSTRVGFAAGALVPAPAELTLARAGHLDPRVGRSFRGEHFSGRSGIRPPALLHLSRRRWVILVAAALIFAATALQTPAAQDLRCHDLDRDRRDSSAGPRQPGPDVAESGAGGYWFTREYTETQTRIITSRAVSQRVVEKLGLQHDPDFLGVADT